MEPNFNILIFLFFLSIVIYIDAELQSPCPNLFLYQERNDSTDRWYGLMNLESSEDLTGVQLKLTLDSPALELGNVFGEVTTYNLKEFVIVNRYFRLIPKASHLLRFYVSYDPTKPLPKLVYIEQNNVVICPRKYAPKIFTSLVLKPPETLFPTPGPSLSTEAHVIRCGTIATEATPLIVSGIEAEIGQFPWHAGIWFNDREDLRYGCGGSLISEQFVVTASHCLTARVNQNANPPLLRKPEDVQVHLGQHYLNDSSNVGIKEVSEVIVHPEYNLKIRNNDIGLIKLKNPVIFNDYIRPVCLWEGDTNYEKMIGEIGKVVGWGYDETGTYSNVLKAANQRLVSYQECLEHNPKFYITRSTFCAISRGGVPCQGDSGGGLVFRNQSSGRDVYYLRGLSSYGPFCRGGGSSYSVYTDIAEQSNFIRTNLL